MQELIAEWCKITNQNNIIPSPIGLELTNKFAEMIDPKRIGAWLFYERDRIDAIDWMPYRESVTGYCIRIYYVNVNPNSTNYSKFLVMNVYGNNIYHSSLFMVDINKVVTELSF